MGRREGGVQVWKWMNYKASEIRYEESGTLALSRSCVTTEEIHLPRARSTDCHFSGDISSASAFSAFVKKDGGHCPCCVVYVLPVYREV